MSRRRVSTEETRPLQELQRTWSAVNVMGHSNAYVESSSLLRRSTPTLQANQNDTRRSTLVVGRGMLPAPIDCARLCHSPRPRCATHLVRLHARQRVMATGEGAFQSTNMQHLTSSLPSSSLSPLKGNATA